MIQRLHDLAFNLFWRSVSGCQKAVPRDLDPDLWQRAGYSPVKLLREIDQTRLDAAAADSNDVADLAAVLADFDAYLAAPTWFERDVGREHRYAYFCAEYGWHEAVALDFGGLGVLAGDHTKAASDLGVPRWRSACGIRTAISTSGSMRTVTRRPCMNVPAPRTCPSPRWWGSSTRRSKCRSRFGKRAWVGAWLVKVGRVSVYLLDVDLPSNRPEDRGILSRLYGGEQQTRISQELILGIGGARMLRVLAITPTSWHMNEGHSAFMAL